MRYKRRLCFILAAGLLVGTRAAEAQSVDLTSSMDPQCVGTDGRCDRIQFALSIPNQWLNGGLLSIDGVSRVGLISNNAAQWVFSNVVRIWTDTQELYGPAANLWTWATVSGSGGLQLEISSETGVFASLPVYLEVEMSTYASTAALYDGSLGYNANGHATAEDGSVQAFSTSGTATPTATPEPMTMVLLGSGLLGLGAARRRRRSTTDEPKQRSTSDVR